MRIPECEFRLLNRVNNPARQTAQFIQETKRIESLLEVEDIVLESSEKITEEMSYKSFKLEHGQLEQEWKQVRVRPIIEASRLIEQNYTIRQIGRV